ncbi:G-protein coupled receptor 84-like [Patiria miniata]|uniref:G-protein coupled receptors family 1 profile domain-containing protein n=1 Tax=Patiria miniata TaxID=46514 RepID=A0A914B7F2_PATMI|nr:G-protein coupled receptor 84-like [Patiria miniata]
MEANDAMGWVPMYYNDTLPNVTMTGEVEMFVEMHPVWIATMCVFYIVVGFLGVFGNCIALVALATTPKLRNTCTALIGNLCVTDLITSLQLLFMMTPTQLLKGFPENLPLCTAVVYLPTTTYSVSLTTLMFIAFNRYLLITRPRTCYRACCGSKQVVLIIALIWLINFMIFILPSITGTREVVYDREVQGCHAETNWLVGTIMMSFYVVVPAFVVVPLLYGLTICAVKASHRRVHARSTAGGVGEQPSALPPGHDGDVSLVSTVSNSVNNNLDDNAARHPRSISKRDINLTRLPILIFIVFAVCWTPQLINHICSRFMKVSVYYRKVASLFIWVNCAINPYLYAWSNRNFRQAYRRILKNLKSNCKARL